MSTYVHQTVCSYHSYFFYLHWLPVFSHIIDKILLISFKSLHGLAPTCLSCPNILSRLLQSSGAELLFVPRSSLSSMGGDLSLLWLLNYGTHCPCVSGQQPYCTNLSPNLKRICSSNIIGHYLFLLKLLRFNAVSDCLPYLTICIITMVWNSNHPVLDVAKKKS